MSDKYEIYIRYECVNFDCQINPAGYYLVSPMQIDDEPLPTCTHCGALMVREDEMAKNALLWELDIPVME